MKVVTIERVGERREEGQGCRWIAREARVTSPVKQLSSFIHSSRKKRSLLLVEIEGNRGAARLRVYVHELCIVRYLTPSLP